MILGIETTIGSLVRKTKARFISFECDECSKHFKRKYQSRYISARYHFCSRTCKCKNNKLKKQVSLQRQNTLHSRYGVDNSIRAPGAIEKMKQTCLKRYGGIGLSVGSIRTKYEATMLKLYGVINPMHSPNLCKKLFISNRSAKKYTTKFNDVVLIQSSLEQKFVKMCEENNLRILNGPVIDYMLDNEQHKYYVDFRVSTEKGDHLIEIKSTYWYERQKEIVGLKHTAADAYVSKSSDIKSYLFLLDELSFSGAIQKLC